ncbi:MAG: diguanylate cyclase [bacterium]|nr:diguanylate cyclase [bacterium]
MKAGPRILIVEDSAATALAMRVALERAGFCCDVAASGEEAWHKLASDTALVLLDIELPGESGPDVLRRLQADPTLAKIPVVFSSSRSDAATRIQCLAMGARAFLAKPVATVDLVVAVTEVLARDPEDPNDDPLADVLGDEIMDVRGVPANDLVRSLLAERQRLRTQVASHGRLVSAVLRLHQTVAAGVTADRVAQTVVQLAEPLLGAEAATLWVSAGPSLVPLATSAPAPPAPVALAGEGPVAEAWRTRRAVEADDVQHVPLTVAAEPIGVLSIQGPGPARASSSLAGFFCVEAALALDAAQRFAAAEAAARTDAVTGLANRRYLDRRLGEELRRARLHRQPLAVLFLDLDHFKRVNDTLGHDRGDAVLRAVGTALRSALRAADVIARYGGEEFVVLLPEVDRAGAAIAAERVRAAVAAETMRAIPDGPAVTATIGVATFPDDGSDAASLVTLADAAMLRGKQAGRNRVEVAAGPVPVPAPEPGYRGTAGIVRALFHALTLKDPATAEHSARVGGLAARLARFLDLPQDQIALAAQAGVLHDVGKLHVPDEVLLKPGPLDDTERIVMERHVPLGTALLTAVPETRHLAAVAHACQEHWDGGGYPEQLCGEDIPIAARIIAVVDAWHAMTTDRPYRRAMPAADAVAELRRCAGSQFDPTLTEALLSMLDADLRA